MRALNIVFLCVLIVATAGCGTKKKAKRSTNNKRVTTTRTDKKKNPDTTTTTTSKDSGTNTDTTIATPKELSYAEAVAWYIDTFSEVAQQEMIQYGIPASVTMAQGILESGAGRSDLTQRANNHFGIKCHTEWTGERVYHDDDAAQECFRKYIDAKYSFRDHSLFLTTRSRYKSLFSLRKDDYKGWARGLKKAGYATDPKYPNKLISIIERYNLAALDQQVLDGTDLASTTNDEAGVKTYIVRKGDTLYSISRKFNVSVDNLKSYNGLGSNTIAIGQSLYLHPVKN